MDQDKKTLGEKLRDLRETYDLTQKQVADALNIDRSTYSNYELDKTRPSLEALVTLARMFNISKEALMPDDPDDPVSFKGSMKSLGMVQSLSKVERGLIARFRGLSAADKAQLLDELSKLTKKNHPNTPK